MGAWGTAIFSDDTALDTKGHFTDLIAEGLTPVDATNRIIAESSETLDDEDEAVVFWLALAATQWKLGRLVESVRDRAIEIIDSGVELRRWEESPRADIKKRTAHLQKLRTQLLSPPPKPKKIRPSQKSSTDFQPGDVAAYRLDDQTMIRFCVLSTSGDRGGTYASICLLGLDDGEPFLKTALQSADTMGPHYFMILHEPKDRITLLRRGVELPEETPELRRAWFRLPIRNLACTWDEFPARLREVLPTLGWR